MEGVETQSQFQQAPSSGRQQVLGFCLVPQPGFGRWTCPWYLHSWGPAWPSPRRLAVKRLSYSHCSHGPRRKAISLPAHICMPCHACGNPLTHSLLQETPVGTPSPGWAGLAAGNGENMPACAVSPFPALTISLLQCWAGFFFFFFHPRSVAGCVGRYHKRYNFPPDGFGRLGVPMLKSGVSGTKGKCGSA